MNNEDKILITAYLDGDTSELETQQVEDLLANDSEALEYANNLKRANIEINNYFEGDEMSRLNKSVDQFISSQIKKESLSPSQNGFLSKLGLTGVAKLLSPTKAIGALAASIVLGVLVIPMVFQNDLNNELIFNIEIERSANFNFETVLNEKIEIMIQQEASNAKLVFPDEIVELELSLQPKDRCYDGSVTRNKIDVSFTYCFDGRTGKLNIEN